MHRRREQVERDRLGGLGAYVVAHLAATLQELGAQLVLRHAADASL